MSLFDGVTPLQVGLDYHLSRHNVLASNLAHIDTPEYKPVDLIRRDKFEGVMRVQMQGTDGAHLGIAKAGRDFDIRTDHAAQTGEDGNSVSIDREAVKIASNHVRYEVISQMVAGRLGGLLWAASDART